MRVTHKSITYKAIVNMQRSLRQVEGKTNEISTGRQISLPSDDPSQATRALGYQQKIAQSQQYSRNMDTVVDRLNQTESALGEINGSVVQIKEIALTLKDPSITTEELNNAFEKLSQLKEQLVKLGNTKVGDQYIFGGSNTTSRSFELTDDGEILYRGNTSEINVEMGDNIAITTNIPGTTIFSMQATTAGVITDKGVFGSLDTLIQVAQGGEPPADFDNVLDEIDGLNNTVINARAINSNRGFRAESAQESLSAEQTSVEGVLASIMETDTALALTELLSLQEAYQLTLNVVNKSFQRSLVDVLG
jgi:flagellar hook-associated protein 3 FlgL